MILVVTEGDEVTLGVIDLVLVFDAVTEVDGVILDVIDGV